MKKIGLLKNEKMGDYEKKQGWASYRTLVNYYIGGIVLCNNIIDEDESVIYNMNNNGYCYYNEQGEEISEEEYNNDESGKSYCENAEIYQYYLCNVNEWGLSQLEKMGVIMSYSNKLDCDVLCVDHFGTSWDYVLTNVKLFDNYEELEKYEKENGNDEE